MDEDKMIKGKIVLNGGYAIETEFDTLDWKYNSDTGRITEISWAQSESAKVKINHLVVDEIAAILHIED